MTRRIRWIRGDAAYCETQRTVDRQFLFKPDPVVRNIIGQAAGRALEKYPVKIYWLDFNINHKHCGKAPLSDSPEHLENMVKFDRLFHSLLARGINKHLKREGPLFSGRNRSDEARDDESLAQQLFYAVTNPVKDGLVENVSQWKGFSSYEQLATGKIERYWYIDWAAWYEAGGERSKQSPETFIRWTEVRLTPLPGWEGMPAAKRQALFRRGVKELEGMYAERRKRERLTVVGPRKLAALDPRERPKLPAEVNPRPRCHASTAEAAAEYEEQLGEFMERYRRASQLYLAGARNVRFPPGSYRPPLISVVT